MVRTPTQFMNWLALNNPHADLSLTVVNESGKPHWVLHFEGLPEHIGVIHAEADTAERAVDNANTQIANAIARYARKRAEERALRCRFATKKRYLNEGEAVHALRTIARTWPPGEIVPTEAYYCDPNDPKEYGCGGWHLTSHPRGRVPITEPLRPKEMA